MFLADLVRAMTCEVTLDFMAVSSYGIEHALSGQVRLLKDLDSGLEGRVGGHRRGHRGHRADAGVPAGDPARARPAQPEDGVPSEQAVAPEDQRGG